MTPQSAYDQIANQYAAFVQEGSNDPTSVMSMASQTLLEAAGNIRGLDICDLACGEGHLTIRMAELAQRVTGIDLSEHLLNLAKQKGENRKITFIRDDAQRLSSQPDAHFDLVISNLALMDIPDLQAIYASVYRVLRPKGLFVYSITHPCFQAPHATTESDHEGNFVTRCIKRYASEGFWRSDYAEGIRGKVGATHRMLSTYLNMLIASGFHLIELIEPTLPASQYPSSFVQGQVEIPSVLVVKALKPGKDDDALVSQ